MKESGIDIEWKWKLPGIIVDIDGTLTQAPLLHRDTYEFDKCIDDLPNKKICEMVRCLSFGYNIIIMTAREEKYRHYTENWLKKHRIKYIELMMKKNDDKQLSVDAKEEMYDLIKTRYNIYLALDDQFEIIQMYNRQGLYTILV